MTMDCDLVLRNVIPLDGILSDVALRDGLIVAIAPELAVSGPELDGQCGALIPGLADHHIHLLATAARRSSLSVGECRSEEELIAALHSVSASLPVGQWMRVLDYDERIAGLPDRRMLDRWMPKRPMRMLDRTGALWCLNSAGLDQLVGGALPDCVEKDERGTPTGRIWRGDDWLRLQIGGQVPPLAALGQSLARLGITAVADVGAQNGRDEASVLAMAHRAGDLPQRLMIMGSEELAADQGYHCGPLKLLIDERDLPDSASLAARIVLARSRQRAVAAHCVTAAELLVYLDALDRAGGAQPGDRIEHGGVIPVGMIAQIAEQGLVVVTQPAFIHDRGERYLDRMDPLELADLYRASSLVTGGVQLAAGSDAPYGSYDPWHAMACAGNRQTSSGTMIGVTEALPARQALNLYLGSLDAPGQPRRIELGQPADFCLLDGTLDKILAKPDAAHVRATIIGGSIVYQAAETSRHS